MRQIVISLDCPKKLSNARICELLGKMIDIAQCDAEETVDCNDEDGVPRDEDANDTLNITVNKILPL